MDYGFSAIAAATSRRRLGDIVDERTTLLTYAPFAPVGLARTTASTTEVRFAINASSLNESLPAGMLPENFSWEGSLQEIGERAMAHVERAVMQSVLRECKWNKTRAAEKLGVSPKTLLGKMRAAGLEE